MDALGIPGRHDLAVPQITFAFGRFAGQDVAGEGTVSLDFTRRGFPETFGRTPVGFHFRHILYLQRKPGIIPEEPPRVNSQLLKSL